MSRMLTLIDAGWESIRASVARGRRYDAIDRATTLLARPDLPAAVAFEAHQLVGELHTEAERYTNARRHLRAAAALEPTVARTFYLWGIAFEQDPHGCDRRATLRFRRACELEPENTVYRAAFGRAAVRCGRSKFGVRTLLAAVETAPDDIPTLRIVTDGLLEAGKLNAARRVLVKARFLNPTSRQLAACWDRMRFEETRKQQRLLYAQQKTTRHGQDAENAKDGGRVVLPFVRLVGMSEAGEDSGNQTSGTGSMRRDVVSLPKPHFPRLLGRKADR